MFRTSLQERLAEKMNETKNASERLILESSFRKSDSPQRFKKPISEEVFNDERSTISVLE